SPAINAGDNSLAVDANGNPLTTDLAGNLRVVDGTVDMGAFESSFIPLVVTISPVTANVNEGGASTVTITRPGCTTAALIVNFTVGGTASSADYALTVGATPVTTSAIIPAGQASVDVTLAATDDIHAEADETVIVTLAAGTDYTLGATTVSTVTIA